MTSQAKTAYITGGASGIGRAVASMLAQKGVNLILADINLEGAQIVAKELTESHNIQVKTFKVDVADWKQQEAAFKEAASGTRIDYVFAIAGIGERAWIGNAPDGEYAEPNLLTLDIDLKGVLYTTSLAVQHFRRQKADNDGVKGRIISIASICGLYCVPTLPIYTAAKHAIVGFTRSYGVHLAEEGITLNAICPNIVQTAISSFEFYAKVRDAGVLVPIENVVSAVEGLLQGRESGQCVEVGPRGTRATKQQEWMDQETRVSCEMLHERARALHKAG